MRPGDVRAKYLQANLRLAAKTAGRNRRAAFSSSAVRASGERDAAEGIITNRAYTIPPTSVTADDMCTHRMMAVRYSPILGEYTRVMGTL